jgi:predicted secreted protein
MSPIRSLLPCAALPLLLASCARRATFSDPATPITVRPGQTFDLALRSNESTGYRWILVDSARMGAVAPGGHRYQSEAPERNGAGGTDRLRFHALNPGTGLISLVYARGDDPTPPADTTRFHVIVRWRPLPGVGRARDAAPARVRYVGAPVPRKQQPG